MKEKTMNNGGISGICHIIGAADFAAERFKPAAGDLVIACDAGVLTLEKRGIEPDVILGDFDSLGYVPEGENVVVHPVRKNYTDSVLAIDCGMERGYGSFILHGCTGGRRFDHTVANLQTLAYADARGADAWLFGKNFTAFLLHNASLSFTGKEKGSFSVFAYGGAAYGVTEKGLDYTVENAEMSPDDPFGVSNAFIPNTPAFVAVESGKLLVIWQSENESELPEIRRTK